MSCGRHRGTLDENGFELMNFKVRGQKIWEWEFVAL